MSSIADQLMTAEEFLTYVGPPGCKVELVRGEVVTVCLPGFRHGWSQGRTYSVLDQYVRTTRLGRAVVETGVRTDRGPDTVRGPDVSYWSAERLPLDQIPVGYPELAPDLCVEVLSPHNRLARIREKMREYFAREVRMVWVVDPEDRTLTVYRSLDEGLLLHENATVQVEDVLPGFRCQVAELFS
jgi:Uma2 family endonuclease